MQIQSKKNNIPLVLAAIAIGLIAQSLTMYKIQPMLNEEKPTEINFSLWKLFTNDAANIKDRMWVTIYKITFS